MKQKSTVDTNTPDTAKQIKVLGGMPPTKDEAAIIKANSPSSRKPAPGSIRGCKQ